MVSSELTFHVAMIVVALMGMIGIFLDNIRRTGILYYLFFMSIGIACFSIIRGVVKSLIMMIMGGA